MSKTTSGSKAEFRRIALIGSAVNLGMGICLALLFGKTYSQAYTALSGAALGGLAGWWVYHLISRRNDFLTIMFLPMGQVSVGYPFPFRDALFLSLCVALTCGCLFGFLLRVGQRRKRARTTAGPMYDAQLDQST